MEAVKVRKSSKVKKRQDESQKLSEDVEVAAEFEEKLKSEDEDSQNSDPFSSSFEIIPGRIPEIQHGNIEQTKTVESEINPETNDVIVEKETGVHHFGTTPTEDSIYPSLLPEIIDDACRDYSDSGEADSKPQVSESEDQTKNCIAADDGSVNESETLSKMVGSTSCENELSMKDDTNCEDPSERTDFIACASEVSESVKDNTDTAVYPQLENLSLSQEICVEENSYIPSAPCLEEFTPFESGTEKGPEEAVSESSHFVKPFSAEQILSLYENPILEAKEDLIKEFISGETSLNKEHELFELLCDFLRARNSLRVVERELEGAKYDANECVKLLWLKEQMSCSDEGVCEDGKTVKATHKFEVAEFSEAAASNLKRQYKGIRDILYEKHSLHGHNAQVSKLQIENYLSHMILNCSEMAKIHYEAEVALKSDGEQSALLQENVKKVKQCLSILFHFQRQPVKDEEFKLSCREWIVQLASSLLRTASCSDHVFLVSHMLRCPAGVSEWAASLLQVPFPKAWDLVRCFHSRSLNNAVLMLSILCSPIQEREEFMSAFKASVQVSEESSSWLVVDVEGEEEDEIQNTWTHLQENDLVSLINQVPFEFIFRTILGIQRRDDADIYDVHQYNEGDILTLISFASNLVLVLRQGLKTYHSLRFRQLTKRISRLIVHVVEYVTDQMENFVSLSLCEEAWKSRMQVEYDQFFFRSVHAISSSHKLGAWQYLAMLPYTQLSGQLLWKLWYLLHCHYQEDISEAAKDISYFRIPERFWKEAVLEDEDCRVQFEEKLSACSEAESMYLLTTFVNMAAARQYTTVGGFVYAVTIDTLEVGYIRLSTRDSCYKVARDLLARLSSVHPAILTDIITFLSERVAHVGKLCLYLARELPWELWQPSTGDLGLLGEWIYSFPPHTVESQLARLILQGINWGFGRKGLWLPHEQHRKVCVMVVEAVCKHAPEKSGLNISSLTVALRNPSPSEALYAWAWNLLYRLHLHPTDLRGAVDSDSAMLEPNPDLMKRWQNNKQGAVGYSLVSMSCVGCSVPELCRTGLSMVLQLSQQYQYKATLVLLSNVVPLFLPCPDDLLTNAKFISTLQCLLSADVTYLKMAKNLISNEFPGHYLKLFGDMIDAQIIFHEGSWNELIFLWIRGLTSQDQWNKNASVVYLLDKLLRAAFLREQSWRLAKIFFREKLNSSMEQRSGACSGFSSLFNWMSGNGVPGSLLPRYTCPEAPWLALLALDLEQELEDESGLWKGLQRNLLCDVSISIEEAFKAAYSSSTFSGAVPSSSSAIIYRWAHQALDNPIDHPTTPLIWQRFFGRYLCRVPQKEGEAELGCVSQRFVQGQGLLNYSLETKIKKRLQETIDSGHSQEQLFQTFLLWMNEPKLHEATLYLPVLAPQFNTDLLLRLFQDDRGFWMEYVDVAALHSEMEASQKAWLKERLGSSAVSGSDRRCSTPKTPTHRLLSRLHSYDPPLPPPPLHPWTVPLPSVPRSCLLDCELLTATAHPHLVLLNDFTKRFGMQLGAHTVLDCRYIEQVPDLYKKRHVELIQSTPCDLAKVKPGQDCTGEAQIVLSFEESYMDELVFERMKDNRAEWEQLVNRVVKLPDARVCQAAAQLQNIVGKLIEVVRDSGSKKAEFDKSGQSLFYQLVEAVGEDSNLYPPARQLISSLIELLGQEVIGGHPDQCSPLVKCLSSRPQLSGLLAPHFDPSRCDTDVFLRLYQQITSLPTLQHDLIFVLLSKFDLPGWLLSKRPRHSEQSQLIAHVIKAMLCCGFEPNSQMLAFELYRRHMKILLGADFPEHYGEVLKLLLDGTAEHSIAPCVWFDFIHVISAGILGRTCSYPGSDALREYARAQNMLRLQEIRETVEYLCKHFNQERAKEGLYGLYPRYRDYNQCISTLLAMFSHAFIILTLQADKGTLSDNLIEQLWFPLWELYYPWVSTIRVGKNTAGWVQDLAGSGSLLQPWIPGDCGPASLVMDSYVHTLGLLHDVIPAHRSVLSRCWELYAKTYAQQGVKDHVLSVVHAALVRLPWSTLRPGLHDLEIMVKVVDSYLPECHGFLGRVFMSVNWCEVVSLQMLPNVHAKFHCALLALVVKLAREPEVRQSGYLSQLLSQWESFTWHVVDAASYDNVVNWFVMSCDPRIVLSHATKDQNDHALFGFLQLAGGLTSQGNVNQCKEKWATLVRAWVRLLIHCGNKHKQILHSTPQGFSQSLLTVLATIQGIVESDSVKGALAEQLVGEVVHLLNSPSEALRETAVTAISRWVNELGGAVLLHPTLNILNKKVNTMAKAPLLEAALCVALSPPAMLTWEDILKKFPISAKLVKTCVSKSLIVLVYAYLIQQSRAGEDALTLLQQLLQWIKDLKPTEDNEAKLPLVWLGAVMIVRASYEADIVNETAVKSAVDELKQQLSSLGQSPGFLSTIGLGGGSVVPPKCRLMCTGLAAMLESRDGNRESASTLVSRLESAQQPDIISWIKEWVEDAAARDPALFVVQLSSRLYNQPWLYPLR